MGCEGCGEVWASPLMCKVQGTLAGLLALCGCVMVVAGIVVMAGDCPPDRSLVEIVQIMLVKIFKSIKLELSNCSFWFTRQEK